MDGKNNFMFLVLLLLSLGLFGSLSLTYCVWNKQTEVASELQNELHELQKRSEIANIQIEQTQLKSTNSKLESELADVQNKLYELQNELKSTNSRVHLGASDPSQDKGQLKRNVRHASNDTDTTEILNSALSEIIELKQILILYMDCNKNEYNHTKCTLKPGLKGEPGNNGTPGMQGIAGQRGLPGPLGPPGPTGLQGPPGIQGMAGQRGPVGPKGDTGLMGQEGPKGTQGEPGPTGEPGPKGTQGEPGPTGEPGPKGTQGEPGPTGEPGPKGTQGEPGPTGEQGMKGEPGDMGQKGEPGDKGMKGNHGYSGEKGKEGVAGPQGPPGPTGPQGPRGIQGKDGVKGEQGLVGDTGLPGPHGDRGDKGDMGKRGLKGDMGPPGPKGETGERGDTAQKGEPGDKGMKGNQGDPGSKGEKGEQGVGVGVPCGGPGWRRVVFLNMTNSSHVCPAGLNLTTYSRRTCGRAHSGWYSCSSTTFSVGGSQYSRVCGRALAYRFGVNAAFYGYHYRGHGIDGQYVDGLSLTHGAPGSRQHIWTFASGWFTNRNNNLAIAQCPCDNGNAYPSSPFVGNDYFCESVVTQPDYQRVFYLNATLWDGQVCEGGGTCCQLNNPPWFTKNLARYTTDSIELRLCLYLDANRYPPYSDIALELLELYVH